MAGDYDLCGWRVASAIALPDLPRWDGDGRAPDVTIDIGPVPVFDAPATTTPLVEIDAAGRVRFGVAGVADFLVQDGRRITIAPARDADTPDVRLFLLGGGFGYLCHQRGILPLHAATVDIDGEAVSFAGHSGAGKSTLADAFARRGHRVLSDDVSPVDTARGVVLPSLRRVRLWSDSLEHAGWDATGMERCREGLEKFSRSLHGTARAEPLPPRAIFHLRRQSDKAGAPRFRRLRGRDAAAEFRRQVYRWRSLVGLAGGTAAMLRAATAAASFPQHFIVERPFAFDQLDGTVDEIVATVRAAR
ncbi:MAG: Serine kinase [Sphingomonas bacterium]|nr:Serine kinase [Sphingomonas bacterium]